MNRDFTVDLTEFLFSLLVDFDLFECVACFNLFFHLFYVLEAGLIFDLLRNFLLYVLITP
jgi:hypothetical protein